MKDYVVRIAKHGDVLIRADSAEEAASIAVQFDSASWNKFGLSIEVVGNAVSQNGKSEKTIKEVKIKGDKNAKCLKKVLAKRNKMLRKYLDDDEIPF